MDEQKNRTVLGRVEGRWGRGVEGAGWWCCVVYGKYLKGAVVLSVFCNALEAIEVVGNKCIRWNSVPLCYCSGERSCIYSSCGKWIVVWVVGSCLALSGLEVLVGIDV